MGRYADGLLADGERPVLRARQHLLATIIEGRTAWAMFILSLVLIGLDFQLEQGTLRDAFSWLGLALLVVGIAWLGAIYLAWLNQDYVVTTRRVLKVEGILKKRSADSSLEKINDAILEQSVLGRMLGYGNLDILTAAEQSIDRYRMLSQAQKFKRTMLEQKHALEQEAFQIPAPPMRAPGSIPPAPAPRAASMSPDEITRALGDLADLRDRGAITAEDYEAKKSDLLGRL